MTAEVTNTELSVKLDALIALQSAPPQRYLSVKQTAAYVGVSQDSVRRMLSSGKLRRLKPVSGCVRIDREELDSWIQSTANARHFGGRGCAKQNSPVRRLSSETDEAKGMCNVNSNT